MYDDIAKILLTEEQIKKRVREMGKEISAVYGQEEVLAIGILKGGIVFLADLVREISSPVALDFMVVTSYGHSTESSGVLRILKDLEEEVEGRHVLIVEDIIDTGLTMKYLVENLKSRLPASLRVATLLDKPERRRVDVHVDFNGFTIPDEFVVGYGLDFAGKYRNLPYIGILKPEVYQ